jgi:hypothetical protein
VFEPLSWASLRRRLRWTGRTGLFFLGPQPGVAPETVIAAFEGAGLSLVHRIEQWGGGNYMLLFTSSSRSSWMRNSEG